MIEIGHLANLYNVESGDINVNGVLDMHHANGYSGYGEMFPQSYSYNLSTTVEEGETPYKIIDNRDKSETSVDVQRQNDVEQQKSQYKRNISAHSASQPNYLINVNGDVLDMKHANGYCGYGEMFPHSYLYNLSTTAQEREIPCKIIDNRDKSETSVDVQRQNDVEQQEPRHKHNVESGDINVNGDVLDMKPVNGYSGYGEMFPRSHLYNLSTTVQEGETSCNIGDNRDKSETSVDVQRQNDVEHQEPPYKHNISAHTASQHNDSKLYGKIYATEKRHKCDLCDYCSKTSGSLKMHKLIHTGERPHKCDLCDYSAAHSGDLKTHKLIHTGERPYKCDLCDYSTTQAGDLKKHKLIHTGVKPYKCDVCDYRASQKGTLKKHKLIHTGERPYECDLCDYSTTESGNLTRHKLKHTGVKPYKCDLCDYSTKLKGHLKTHKLKHTGVKPYKCDSCAFSASRKGTLNRHQLIHTGEKPYKCDLCDYCSKTSRDLNRHKLIHTGEKPYKCDLCDYSTSRKGHLKDHQRIHTGERPYKCDLCDYSTITSTKSEESSTKTFRGETFEMWFMWIQHCIFCSSQMA